MIDYLQLHGAMAQLLADAPRIYGPGDAPVVNDMDRTAHGLNARMFKAAAAMLQRLRDLEVNIWTLLHKVRAERQRYPAESYDGKLWASREAGVEDATKLVQAAVNG